MLTDFEKMQLIRQRQQAGDSRPVTNILADILADYEAMQTAATTPPVAADAVIGSEIITKDGKTIENEILGDGSRRLIRGGDV